MDKVKGDTSMNRCMNVDHPVVGGSTYEAIGNVSTSSGTKSFAVHWSGL